MKRCAITRFLACMSLLLSVVALAGCAEESLDVPLRLDGTIPIENAEIAKETEVIHPAPSFADEPSSEVPHPSVVKSVWNALLNGTAQAMDESPVP